jgi:hypothetical protein
MDKPATPDYYEALQISPAAQSLIVTKAYRLLAAKAVSETDGTSLHITQIAQALFESRATARRRGLLATWFQDADQRDLPCGCAPAARGAVRTPMVRTTATPISRMGTPVDDGWRESNRRPLPGGVGRVGRACATGSPGPPATAPTAGS